VSISLIIAADEPAIFYRSIGSAELDLESNDVLNGVYTAAFGTQGEVYNICSHDDRVKISRDQDKPDDPTSLRKILIRFLDAAGLEFDNNLEISQLLTMCEPYAQ
jgi:hypothetical protein